MKTFSLILMLLAVSCTRKSHVTCNVKEECVLTQGCCDWVAVNKLHKKTYDSEHADSCNNLDCTETKFDPKATADCVKITCAVLNPVTPTDPPK